jgi:hypothetical protein
MKPNQLALFADTPIETPLAAIERQLDVYRKRAVSDGYRARCLPAWLQKQPDSVKRACWQLLAQRNPTSVRIANRLKIALAKEVQL